MKPCTTLFRILALLLLPLSVLAIDKPHQVQSFSDIPGVTSEDITNIERIRQARPEGLSYAMLFSNEAFVDDCGGIGGFTHLLCAHLSDLFGIKITPVIVGWNELIAGLDNRRFDMSGDLAATVERRKKYFMTSPIAERSFALYRSADKPEIDLINSRKLLRYGFLDGSSTYDRVRATSELTFDASFLQNYQDATHAIRTGKVDAFIVESTVESAFEAYSDIACQKYYPLTFATVSLCTANPEVRPIIDIFQKYLDNGGDEDLYQLYVKGYHEYHRYKLMKQLTGEEKEFIARHTAEDRAIPVAAEFDHYPASFYNWREKKWRGVTHEIFQEIGELTGLKFRIINRPDESWSSILEKLERGDAHIVTHLAKSKDREGRFLWSKQSYMSDTYALLSSSRTEDIPINRVGRTKVGLIHETAYEEAFHRIFPDSEKIRIYPDTISGFEALDRGEVTLVMMTRILLLSATNFMERPDFKVNIPLELPCHSYFGFNKDQRLLRSIMDKALTLVDTDLITDRWQRKVFDYRRKLAEAKIPYLVSICALLSVVLGLVIALFGSKVRKSSLLSMTDHLTTLPNRRGFDKRLQQEWDKSVNERLPISLLMVDVDHFKQFNDNFGHHQGDVMLKAVAQALRSAMQRKEDMAARIGGEEFGIILPNTDKAGALRVAEKLRAAVEHATVECSNEHALRVTISVGAASIKPKPADSLEEFQKHSDTNLYRAKEDGRNRVCGE